MFSLSTSVVVLAGLVSNCLAFPTRFNGGCYVPDGRRVMGNAASTDTNVCKLVYSGAGTLDKYIPGQSYQFKVTGPNGKSILLGSDHGTWTGGDATCSSNGQKGVIGNFKSELVATWTAPSTAPGAAGGRVKI